jgi:glutamate racemase
MARQIHAAPAARTDPPRDPMPHPDPIGVFDSGVGGLSVLREIRRELPREDLFYVADSRHAPYGDKPQEVIEARSLAITEFLLAQGAKAVVVACNTATAVAVSLLRTRFSVPIVAMEPAIKPAVAYTRSGVVGVLATAQTAASHRFVQLLGRFNAGAEVLVQPCPGLVEQIEAGDLDGEATRALLADYLTPLLEQGADTLVLGCTHYPLLSPVIQELAGPEVTVMTSGAAVARQIQRRLDEAGLLARHNRNGTERFWTSAAPDAAEVLIGRLWGAPVAVERLPERLEAVERAEVSA